MQYILDFQGTGCESLPFKDFVHACMLTLQTSISKQAYYGHVWVTLSCRAAEFGKSM